MTRTPTPTATPTPTVAAGPARASTDHRRAGRVTHLDVDQRAERGRRARAVTPPSEHALWNPPAHRVEPSALLTAQDRTREPDLVPVRHGRMLVSPFTFYRGAAAVMAEDLAATPTSGLTVQLCGDAHLANFGLYASPERLLLFDVNDFDETLPGPFEYDVKRLATSLVAAARDNGFSRSDARAAASASVTAYREAMTSFAGMRTLDIWYARVDESQLQAAIQTAAGEFIAESEKTSGKQDKASKKQSKKASKKQSKKTTTKSSKGAASTPDDAEVARAAVRRAAKTGRKARMRDSVQALASLGEQVDGRYRIASRPPLVVPARDLAATYGMSAEAVESAVHDQFRAYRASLPDERRHLAEQFRIVDIARKVVGVGSVGTRCFIALLQGRDADDPLFLQVKEATPSVLEGHLPRSRYRRHGERVVQGQRMMQAASDIFLGWTEGLDAGRHYYWRQLRDMKGAAQIDLMGPTALAFYGRLCGWTLARAHARSGDPVAIAAYLGDDDGFDRAVTAFAERYADQNEQDHADFAEQVRIGRLAAVTGV